MLQRGQTAGVVQPAAYCYGSLRCAAAATTGASGPLLPAASPIWQYFAKYFPDTCCLPVPVFAIILPRDESSVWRDRAADSGGCRPGHWAVTGSCAAARLCCFTPPVIITRRLGVGEHNGGRSEVLQRLVMSQLFV